MFVTGYNLELELADPDSIELTNNNSKISHGEAFSEAPAIFYEGEKVENVRNVFMLYFRTNCPHIYIQRVLPCLKHIHLLKGQSNFMKYLQNFPEFLPKQR